MVPQVNDENTIYYEFVDETVKIKIDAIEEMFDFSGVPDGELEIYDDFGELKIETDLNPFPIISAEKKENILYLELLNWIDENASESERFPDWIDSENYIPIEEGKDESKENVEK